MLHWKQCGSWSAGFVRSQLIWIYTVYKRVDICMVSYCFRKCKLFKHRKVIALDKAAYCVFTQFRGPENAIKLISVHTKTQKKSLILNSELFRSVWRYCIVFPTVVFRITSCCWVQIYTRRRAESSLLNCKPVKEHSYGCLAIPNINTITTFVSLYNNKGITWAKKPQRNWMISYRN